MYNIQHFICVTEHKFMCPTHSEAKQTKMSAFGAEKGSLQGHARRWVAHAPKIPKSRKGFSKAFLKAGWVGGSQGM